MEPTDARNMAYACHGQQRNRAGELIVEHLERVAASVPRHVQAIAFLHDVLEHTPTPASELEAKDLTRTELAALMLLTRDPDESFEAHTLRIAYAKGPEGRLARAVKLADVEDHIAQSRGTTSFKPYGWARCHVTACQARLNDSRVPLHSAA
jgi:hypothetical protein